MMSKYIQVRYNKQSLNSYKVSFKIKILLIIYYLLTIINQIYYKL